jgi:outer membrane immunogenic protein
MKTTLAVLTIGASALFACPAGAAAAYWTGFYVGAEVGQQQSETDWRTTSFGSPDSQDVFDTSTAKTTFKTSDLRAGGVFGYDYQVLPHLVIGAEAGIGADFGSKTKSGVPAFGFYTPGEPHEDTIKYKTNWDGNLVLKVGVPVLPSTLLFVTGGVAFIEREFELHCGTGDEGACQPTDPFTHEKTSDTMVGWTVGAGFETRLTDHFSLRFDYRYADYGSDNHLWVRRYAPGTPDVDNFNASYETTSQNFNAALIFRF